MGRLEGKVALVTGAASDKGLGCAIARRFAEEGAVVFMTDIDLAGVEANAEDIRKTGGHATALAHDVTSEADWDAVIAAVMGDAGKLDILVNNAGISDLRPLEALDTAAWQRMTDINMTSVFHGTKRAVEAMRKGRADGAQQGGSIVNISSAAGLAGVPYCTSYCAAKGGVRMFSKAVAIECAKEAIRCNSIHPGLIATSMGQGAVDLHGDAILASIPMGRLGRPEDIANAALYLASDESAFVTGAELAVDGGSTAQ